MCGYCVESAYFERAFDCNRDAGAWASTCAPAVAVAVLLAEERHG